MTFNNIRRFVVQLIIQLVGNAKNTELKFCYLPRKTFHESLSKNQ